jgi:hypothetical protein
MTAKADKPPSGEANKAPPPPLTKRKTLQERVDDVPWYEEMSGAFRGVAAALRKTVMAKTMAAKSAAAKIVATKQAGVKAAVRAVGDNRPLAFASEGAVAADSVLPRVIYYGAWALSGAAIGADIYNKQDAAPAGKQWQTALYWTTFHIPASLVVPAVIIHQIVHQVSAVVENPTGVAKSWTPRARALAPAAAALLSIVPVVPLVDYAAEQLLEPTWGAYLGVEFAHHGAHAVVVPTKEEDVTAKKKA